MTTTTQTNIFLSADDDLNRWLIDKHSKQQTFWSDSLLQSRWQACFNFYYGSQITGLDQNPGIKQIGTRGELSGLSINEYRAALKHIYSIVTQNKLTFDILTYNSDQESRLTADVGKAVLDYYMGTHGFEEAIKSTVELAIGAHGTAYLETVWEPNTGKLIGIGKDGKPVFSGKPVARMHSVYDIVVEPLGTDWDAKNWVAVRNIINKYDLAAQYPDKADEIINQAHVASNHLISQVFSTAMEDTIYYWTFYHKPTPALPRGRCRIFLTTGETLQEFQDEDGSVYNPYGELPIFIYRPELRYGHVWGYTPAFDLLPVQEAANRLDSSIMSNLSTFAIQNIVLFDESGVTPQQVGGGMKALHVKANPDAPNGGAPQALQLCSMPQGGFDYRALLSQKVDIIVGSNEFARGQQSSEASGTATALAIAQAKQANSTIESNYIAFAEKIASFLLTKIVKQFQAKEELIAISGTSNSYAVNKFKGEDLDGIARVKVLVGNPLGQSLAGRIAVAKDLAAPGAINADQYLQIVKTGDLDGELDTSTAQDTFIKQLGEMCLKGIDVPIMQTDNHQKIIKHLKMLSQRMDVRLNNEILSHIQQKIIESIDLLEQVNANNPITLQISLDMPLQLPAPIPGVNSAPGGTPMPPQPSEKSASKQSEPPKTTGNPQQDALAKNAASTENLANRASAMVNSK
jgi:hypothetical protein